MYLILISTLYLGLISRVNCLTNTTGKRLEKILYTDNFYVEDGATWRLFFQKYNFINPVVLLVDNVQQNHEDARNFIKDLSQFNPRARNIKFILMKYNATGVSTVLETSLNNPERFRQLLEVESEEPSSFLGQHVASNQSAAFFAILNAARVLTWNSGVVVFTARKPQDEDLAQLALQEILRRRIQVFVVWGGNPTLKQETVLKELALQSGGDFYMSTRKKSSKYYSDNFLQISKAISNVESILSMKNLRGERNIRFPIDSEVTGVHLSITPNITMGILTSPSGKKMNVLNDEEIAEYSYGSFTKHDSNIGSFEIHLNTSETKDVGFWRFFVNSHAFYDIAIFAHTQLTTNAYFTLDNTTGSGVTGNKKVMKIGISGDVTSITNVGFINQDGQTIADNVKFDIDNDWTHELTENIDNIETNTKKEINVDIENIPKDTFYTVVNGKDSQGHDFTRLSHVREYRTPDQFYLPPITVELGLSSTLIAQPNSQPQLLFEVTNNGNKAILARFYCKDERSILLSMSPWYQWINPKDTVNVRLTLTTRPGSYQDHITFTVDSGTDTIAKNVIVDVGLNAYDDRTDPELDYEFTSDCLNVLLGSCEDGTWTVRVTARDSGSGLLLVDAKPRRLYFPSGFTSGTKDAVTGYFSESCCNPDLKLIAYDREQNRRTRDLNAYRARLGPGAIAAIILGVIIIILIILLIIWAIIKGCCGSDCCKKKESYDLPTYRAPRRQ